MSKTISGVRDARYQLFHNELIRNENTIRMKWFLKNQQRLIDNLQLSKLAQQAREVIAKSEKQEKKKRVKPTAKWKPLPRPPISIDIMKPVNSDVRAILYEKGVPSFTTADDYLNARCREPPEKRYYFPECESWMYGWRLDDYPSVPLSKVALKSVMLTQFYHRKAYNLQRDPDWYRGCQTKNAKNFNDC